MIVGHLDLDAFFAAVEELEDPTLETKPLVVGGDPHGRGVVATASFLAPFDVRRLPGVGPKAEERLVAAGVTTIGALAALGDVELRTLLPGSVGRVLRDRACGIDPRGLEEQTQRISISVENTFERDVADREQLHAELRRMADRLAENLRTTGRTARTVSTKLRYSDFSIRTRSTSLRVGIDEAAKIG